MTAYHPGRSPRGRTNAVRIRRLACAAGLALLHAAACAPAAVPAAVPAAAPADAQGGVAIPRERGRVTSGNYDPQDVALAWTPAGELIVGHTEQYASYDVVERSCYGTGFYAVPVAGGAARSLAEGDPFCSALDEGAAVSRDGGWAVFVENLPDRRSGLVRMDLATRRMDTLAVGCAGYQDPAVSPDGTRIAVLRLCGERDEDFGVYVMSADGGGVRMATGGAEGMVEPYAPAWSPDGRRIAFSWPGQVAVVDADGTGARRLTPGHAPAWSPDGAWIAFLDFDRDDRRTFSIFVVRPDGSGRRTVFRNDVRTTYRRGFGDIREGGPRLPLVWSPDGRWIAFSRSYGGGTSIWRVEVESGRVEPVTRPDR